MSRRRFHGLKRLKLRQSWNKYNLYNMSRATPLQTPNFTLFQQKWYAKAAARAYHGETVREKQWQRMHRSTLNSVVPMDARYMAQFDGSEQGRGRGSGPELSLDAREKAPNMRQTIPYSSMVFAPIERRLDTAVFRAMFASSTKQARQFVVHGYVKVNGKKMIYPGYQLNPGDMFQVDPDRVMYASGAPKDEDERAASRLEDRPMQKLADEISSKRPKATEVAEAASEDDAQADSAGLPQQEEAVEEAEGKSLSDEEQKAALKETRASLRDLIDQAKDVLSTSDAALTVKRKQELREFQRAVRKTMPRPSETVVEDLTTKLNEITSQLDKFKAAETQAQYAGAAKKDVPKMSSADLQVKAEELNPEQLRVLRKALQEARENPFDPSKPYATPWRPRDYMSAFAFIPRYLEVNQRICSAVYLRHPVARPGLTEVPTPFNPETLSLVHSWYLRRR